MKVYCGHQISGLTTKAVFDYYDKVSIDLRALGYTVLSPMTAKEQFAVHKDDVFVPFGYDGTASNHAIVERDCWMVQQADIIFMNLFGMTEKSVGCISETAWAHLLHKHVVMVMEKTNPNQHAFMKEMADIVFEDYGSAMEYLKKLSTVNFANGGL